MSKIDQKGADQITQEYLRRYPVSKRAKSWAGRMVHIRTENGVWRHNGAGYTYAGQPGAWVLPFEAAQKLVSHCGPEKQVTFIEATATTPAGDDLVALVDEYWDLALAEGKEGRNHDTPDGDAQRVRSAIASRIQSLTASNRALADERDDVVALGQDLAQRLTAAQAEIADLERVRMLMAHDWNDFCKAMGVTLDTHEAVASGLQAEIATLNRMVERAFKDGVHYATIIEVKNTDEARDEAWHMSSVRTALSTPQEPK